nr:hypothetical protein [Actinoallomurus iriomotensis]
MDGTPVRCGASRVTVDRSLPGEIAAYGRGISHHAFYWGAELMLITTVEGAVTAFSLANPKELEWARLSQRILALNAAIWHNWLINAPVKRSLS